MNDNVISPELTIRLECLEAAVRVYPHAGHDLVLRAAKQFEIFVVEGKIK